eukprot:GHVH01011305.1.p1 GENE.GHVH01011305.1~~GHVH01011305.1.p1  ORF type:complete len:279 (+),score=41.41 GHVH01011305.1:185-1021(+)
MSRMQTNKDFVLPDPNEAFRTHGFGQTAYPGPIHYDDKWGNAVGIDSIPKPRYVDKEGGKDDGKGKFDKLYENQDNNLKDGAHSGKYVIPATRPVVAVPVYQEVQRRDRIIEVPQTVVVDKICPKVYHQEVFHEVPNLDIKFKNRVLKVPEIEIVEKLVEIPVPVGMSFQVKPVWKTREVPRVIPVYIGEQEIVYVEVPKVKVVEKTVETEVPVYIGEKVIRKEVYDEEIFEIYDYQYVPIEEEVPVYRYKPVIDIEVDIPAPLVVPVPMQPEETVSS